jgi:hypothetical protein
MNPIKINKNLTAEVSGWKNCITLYKKKVNSVAVVRKRTIPTERPPLVGEVSANLCGYRVLRGQRNEFPRPLISFF